jgi:pathogenesis-related protein 1
MARGKRQSASTAERRPVTWPVKAPTARFAVQIHRTLTILGLLAVALGSARAQPQKPAAPRGVPSASILAREMVTAHNTVRSALKLPSLQWSAELATISQKWADTLVAQRRFAHNPDSPYGENLFMITGGAAASSMVVEQWISESRDYDYQTNKCNGVCGHYTQVVWRRTRKVGCAVARGSGREVWVCSYDPPGNFVGAWPY